MSEKKGRTGLGRGLNSLLGEMAREAPVAGDQAAAAGLRTLPVASLKPHPNQPRRRFDEAQLDELAGSIAARGLIQPIVVRPHGHEYQIVAGERRWRAAQRARLTEVPVVIRELDDDETLEIALVENIQRADLNAIEEAQAYHRLLRQYGHTQEALATLVHKSRSHVANLLRLLDLPEPVQARVVDGSLSMGHARDAKRRPGSAREAADPDPDSAALERQLADLLGVSVRVAHGPSGGTLTLGYASLDQLDMLCQRLTGEAL